MDDARFPDVPVAFADGRYEVRGLLQAGGRRRVLLAHDEFLDRDVVITWVDTRGLGPDADSRVLTEARALAKIGNHPHVVDVYDAGVQDGLPYLVTRYAGDWTLADVLERSAGLPAGEAVRIADQILRALEQAHALGVVHRDIRPQHVWLANDGSVELGGFGLAVSLGPGGEGSHGAAAPYAAPEPVPDARSDLYAVGVVLREMLSTGLRPGVPLAGLVGRLVDPDPARRPATASEARMLLASCAPDEQSRERRLRGLAALSPPGGRVTILFTDIVGSTVVVERVGDRAWLDVVRRHDEVVRRALEVHGGVEVDTAGDGFMIAFGDAHGALRCAIDIQDGLGAQEDGVRVRIGVHTGEAIRDEDRFYGRTVHLAARVVALAGPGEILVSAPTRELAGDAFEFDEADEVELRGLAGTHRVFRLAS